MSDFAYADSTGKAFPLLYFWFKDHYLQRSPQNFKKTNWLWHEDSKKTFYNDPTIKEKLDANRPDVFFLSLYIWNDVLLLENARFIKENYPDCLVVVGGPSAEASQNFFDDNPYIDISIIGPGHEIARQLLDNIFDDNMKNTIGIAYREQDKVLRNQPMDRRENLVLLNFLNNFRDEVKVVYDDIVKNGHSIIWLSLLIQGCPYTCTFCEQGTEMWGKLHRRPLQHLLDEIDFLTNYKDVQISLIDSNVGIHKDYEELYHYLIKKKTDLDWNVEILLGDYAKNNLERVLYLQKLATDNEITTLKHGMIALQDTDLDVLKINGRPGDNDYVKIDAYAKSMQEQEVRPNPRVDIMIGLPGQSFVSLTETLITLLKKGILEPSTPPNMFYVLPNTRMTMGNEFPNIKTRYIKRSLMEPLWIEPETTANPLNKGQNTIIETGTLATQELVTMWYLFPVIGFMNYIQYFDTPKHFLKNFHDVGEDSFYRAIIQKFSPSYANRLPKNILTDIQSIVDLLLGRVEYLERRDNHGFGAVNMDKLATYRFMANQEEWLKIISDVMGDLTKNDPRVLDIIQWMRYKTISMDLNYPRSVISLNWDDVSMKKGDTFFHSKFTFDFGFDDIKDLLSKIKNADDIQYLPYVKVEPIDDPDLRIPVKFDSNYTTNLLDLYVE